jgi:O-antigen/teichoic acid export membrane protein
VIWIAIGLGFYVLPETARRVGAGLDPRPVLLRGLAVIGAVTVCALTVFVAAPELLLRTAFGPEYEPGADVLLTLGLAFALLAASYLAAQYQLGLHRRAFLAVLAAAAIAEPLLLIGAADLESFAVRVLAVQAAAAVALLALSARAVTDVHRPAARERELAGSPARS